MSEMSYPAIPDPEGVERVYGELLARAPENKMAPRLDAVRRAVEILGDVHRAAPVIHITGTNGKTSTARMIESLLLAHDLRTGRLLARISKALLSASALTVNRCLMPRSCAFGMKFCHTSLLWTKNLLHAENQNLRSLSPSLCLLSLFLPMSPWTW